MKIAKSKYLKPFKNIYILIGVLFIVWMLFFDANSWIIHEELSTEINDLENEKNYYRKEIKKDKKRAKKTNHRRRFRRICTRTILYEARK